jgi:two-component system phosphate regulon sensor histidine kinase PhoR
MAADDKAPSPRPDISFRLAGEFFVLAAAAVVLAVLYGLGDLSAGRALTAFAFILIAAWVGRLLRRRAAEDIAPAESESSRVGEELRDALIAAFPDPVIVLDNTGRVIALNAQAAAMAPALRRGEVASIALRMPEVVEAIRRTAASGKPERVEFSGRVPAESWSEAFITPFTIPTENGELSHLLLTFHDLTPLRRVEEMRADFVANASHELRTPLATLSGFIDTLKGPARDDAEARERFLAIMEAQATRMARLIDDLLSLSRIELNAHVRPVTPVDLEALVRQVIDALQTLAGDRGVEITVTALPKPLIVPGDHDELVRLFENLIENALKYGGSGKRVTVTLARGEGANGAGEAIVAVRDYGPGIAAEHLPRLTERFYRVDVAGSRAQGGTGLGLALVKHILNRHRGRMAIESKAGEGATFTVRLPVSAI